MAAPYELGFVGAQPISGATGPLVGIRAGTTELRIQNLWVLFTGSGLAGGEQIALYRTSANGTATTAVAGQATDPSDAAALGRVDTAWSVNPTITGQPMRRRQVGPNTGDWLVWHWEADGSGLVVPVSGSVVLWREIGPATAGPVNFGFVSWEE